MSVREQLQTVRIEGFRCIRDLKLSLSADRTVFVGANASGKSSVLEAIQLVADLVRVGPTALSGESRGALGAGINLLPLASFLAPACSVLRVTLGFATGGGPRPDMAGEWTYSVSLAPVGDSYRVAHEALTKADSTELLLERDERGGRIRREGAEGLSPVGPAFTNTLLALASDAISYPEIHPAWRFISRICLLNLTPVLMRGGQHPAEALPDRYGRDLAWRLHRFLTNTPESLVPFLEYMGEFVGWKRLRTPIVNGRLNAMFAEDTESPLISLLQASDGTVNQGYLAALLLDPPDVSVYLLDEPAGVYLPAAISRPAELLRALSSQTQLLIATHDAQLVSQVADIGSVYLVEREPNEPTRVQLASLRPHMSDDVVAVGVGEAAMSALTMVAPEREDS